MHRLVRNRGQGGASPAQASEPLALLRFSPEVIRLVAMMYVPPAELA